MTDSIYDFQAVTSAGEEFHFKTLKGHALLIVNTASRCGFTKQYEGLEKLYRAYREQGLEIIAFPCDQFAHQEPGADAEIEQFCKVNYGVTFPIMSKIEVNGKDTHPLYRWLKSQAPGFLGTSVKWNFTKFLVSKDGRTVTRFAPKVEPEDLSAPIERVL